ncbi:carboxypeptidase-like regulatory domain-containing protein [Aquimarina spongiae]|uniref:CarboxypepD_reg-like domain-containing protein n=1 Tax=Aquimarina spongiae TaxID=570521 RepID=A0A1M6FDA6_9FLAO|nr:carboxypeptidase-like regulatory domain-containing protein [Aquimarina spongiae]SHI95626.1 hypothetical protein SAMN04488508_104223 [Aquimarina spongiae]
MINRISTLKLALVFEFCVSILNAQETNIKGRVIDTFSNENIVDALVSIEKTDISCRTNTFGVFSFNDEQLPLGEQILVISKRGYLSKRFPVVINEAQILDLKILRLDYDFSEEDQQIATIEISDLELEEENDVSFNIPALLQARKDIFLNAAAYDFSAAFFRPRGINNENSQLLINGIAFNKIYNGRPQWSNWGGLNDVQRNQEFSMGISENSYSFGDLLGTSNIIMRASQYRKGGRVSYAASNRTYQGRVMATYNSGVSQSGWAYSLSFSKRFGEEGIFEGTGYNAHSFFASVEKKINEKHSLNFTGFYTPNQRGRSTAITEEVARIKGPNYNPNWGYHNGKIRNARQRRIEEPIFMLNHYWQLSENTLINTNLAYQTGEVGNSRIDNTGGDLFITSSGQQLFAGGGRSTQTNPVHQSNLPSFFLGNPNPTHLDFQNAFLARENLINNGQIDWDSLVATNLNNAALGNNSTYIVYEDRTDDTQLVGNVIVSSKISKHINFNASMSYRSLSSENFAEVSDLLGGNGFLDVDLFAISFSSLDHDIQLNQAQSDLRNPNRIVSEGDRYDYNYILEAATMNGFLQTSFRFNPVDFFIGGKISQSSFQRDGLYENGYFPGNQSFGKSTAQQFLNYGIKTGSTIRIDGLQTFQVNAGYFSKAPTLQNVFVNPRQNNMTVSELTGTEQPNEIIQTVDANYLFRSKRIKARLSGYYTKIEDATDISFFYTQAISGSEAGFVQEIVTDIDKLYYGGELGIEFQITPTLKLKSAAAIGEFRYNNNPELALASTSDVFAEVQGVRSFGKSYIKGYYLPVGPQNVAQLGFEYRDPDFWWFGTTVNYFSNAFINVSPFARTSNFYQDRDGLPFNDIDETVAQSLLQQEQLEDYFLVNAIGGKSWRINNYTLGFFASITNILDQKYRTGGFEQTRNANYRLALEESRRDTPIFGPKYFYGFSTSYYLNFYVRF